MYTWHHLLRVLRCARPPTAQLAVCQTYKDVPFLDAAITVHFAAPLACPRIDHCTAHFGPARVAPAMVARRLQSRRRRNPPAFLGTGIEVKGRRREYCVRTRIGFIAFVIIVVILDQIVRWSFVRKRPVPPLALNPCT